MARITDNYLKKAVPEETKKILSIRIEDNLSVQIKKTVTGYTRSFVFRSTLMTGKSYTEYLGSVNDLTIADARKLAEERRQLLKAGCLNPKEYIQTQLEQQKLNGDKVSKLIDLFWLSHQNLAERTKKRYKCTFKAMTELQNLSISDFLKSDTPYRIVNKAVSAGKISKADFLTSAINILAEIAIDYKYADNNPFLRLKRIVPAYSHKHFKSVRPEAIEEDIYTLFDKFLNRRDRGYSLTLYFLTGFFTLLRPSEVANLYYSDFDVTKGILFVRHTKTLKNGFFVFTNQFLNDLLEFNHTNAKNDRFFSSYDRFNLNRALRHCNCDFSAHGWRSAGMGWLVQHGTPLHVADLILSHKIGDSVTQAYLRSDLPEERQKALLKWNEFLISVIQKVKPELYEAIFIKK